MMDKYINKIICGDAIRLLEDFDENSIDLVLTDPPYFLDKLDDSWNIKKLEFKTSGQVVNSLPAGMKLDKAQGKRFYEWFYIISKKLYKIMKPGAFLFVFSGPRLYHRMASAVDDAGFIIKDCFIWLYTQNQPKSMSLNHFIKKMKIPEKDKNALIKKLRGWKTPQIKSCFEPIVVAQKPYEGTLLKNFIKNNVGLFNTSIRIGINKFPSNVLLVENIEHILDKYFLIGKPTKKEKGEFNTHLTVKPLILCQHIIELATVEDAIVLDPFAGSGTTCLAAMNLKRRFIGIEINKEYVEIARKRLEMMKDIELNLPF
jgi:site-specific DNA-methyltransferase (adenine-specific)